jgi:molybdopterin/thiamine biosynthesis adenylyltransferase
MAHLFQVGVGSGGMVVLDMIARDPAVTRVTLVDPDIYQPHNVERHYFPADDAGKLKVDLAARWIRSVRPEIEIDALPWDLLDPARQHELEILARSADLGICAVDAEPAKYHFDSLMRKSNRSWTLGEVLSGGIGGWTHLFVPGGPCYGCVASHLQRSIQIDRSPAPDYSQPGAAMGETRIPASRASIGVIAALHARVSLESLRGVDPGFSSMLFPLAKVEGVFAEAYKPFRFRIARHPECLLCGAAETSRPAGEDLDVALDEALARLGRE